MSSLSKERAHSELFIRSDGLPVEVFIQLLKDIERAGGFTDEGEE